jgi:hypothetical protein
MWLGQPPPYSLNERFSPGKSGCQKSRIKTTRASVPLCHTSCSNESSNTITLQTRGGGGHRRYGLDCASEQVVAVGGLLVRGARCA